MSNNLPATAIHDAPDETRIVKELTSRSIREFLGTLNLVSESYLAQVLIALWDSGMYEYVRQHGRVAIDAAAKELRLDHEILRSLIEYLVGRGLMHPDGDGYSLSEKGRPYWNYITRGVLISHVAGYNPLLTRLGPLLRKEIDIDSPCLDRVGRLVALGAGYTIVGNGVVPWAIDVIRQIGGKCVMDLGCGAGDFLIQMALQWPDGKGVGIDADADAIAEAQKKAEAHGVSNRVDFLHARLSADPLDIPSDLSGRVDVITAMYILHEFGGHGGADSISQVIAWLRREFPGRKLLMFEGTRADPVKLSLSPPRTYGQLDYSFIHPISRQGPLRTPEEWQLIVEKAGARVVDCIPGFKRVPSWICLYVIDLGGNDANPQNPARHEPATCG